MSKTISRDEKSLRLILCKHEAKRHLEQMASGEAGRESKAKLLGPIHCADKACVSRPVSSSGPAGAAVHVVALADRQHATEQNTGLWFGGCSLGIPASAPNQVVPTDI